MNRQFRLTSTADFQRVRRTGRSYAHPLTVLIASPNGLEHPRFGVSAGRAIGGAVKRNRAKRRLRAALRQAAAEVAAGWDLILVARPGTNHAKWPDLLAAVNQLLRRARVIDNNQ